MLLVLLNKKYFDIVRSSCKVQCEAISFKMHKLSQLLITKQAHQQKVKFYDTEVRQKTHWTCITYLSALLVFYSYSYVVLQGDTFETCNILAKHTINTLLGKYFTLNHSIILFQIHVIISCSRWLFA